VKRNIEPYQINEESAELNITNSPKSVNEFSAGSFNANMPREDNMDLLDLN